MPFTYFAVAGLSVLSATIIAGLIKTRETRRQMRRQLMLAIETPKHESSQETLPAAMVSVRS